MVSMKLGLCASNIINYMLNMYYIVKGEWYKPYENFRCEKWLSIKNTMLICMNLYNVFRY